jgi:hypothetical protein
MKKFTRWLVSKSIKDHQNVNDLKVRARYGNLEGWTSIVINLLLFAVKITIGLSIKSVALIAEAARNLLTGAPHDVFMNILLLHIYESFHHIIGRRIPHE